MNRLVEFLQMSLEVWRHLLLSRRVYFKHDKVFVVQVRRGRHTSAGDLVVELDGREVEESRVLVPAGLCDVRLGGHLMLPYKAGYVRTTGIVRIAPHDGGHRLEVETRSGSVYFVESFDKT